MSNPAFNKASNNVSVIPRRLIGGLHEWRNVAPTVPAWDLVNSLSGEHAGDSLREEKTPWSFTIACCCDIDIATECRWEPSIPSFWGRMRRKWNTT